jgi:predicted MFS family arabinose efflux permease
MESRSPDKLKKVNAVLARYGRRPVDDLGETAENRVRPAGGFGPLAREHARPLLLLTLAMFGLMVTAYFMLKWVPKIVVNLGHDPGSAAGVLVWSSIGGLVGTVGIGLLTLRARIYWLAIGSMVLASVCVAWFGRAGGGLTNLSLLAAVAGLANAGATVGLYAVIAGAFPTRLRATATGFVVGLGRAGSALSPALTGILFAAGYGLSVVASLMALGSLVAAVALLNSGRAARSGAYLAAEASH